MRQANGQSDCMRGRWACLAFISTAALLACRDEPATAPSVGVGPVASVTVTAPRRVLAPGDSVRLTAQAFDARGRVLPTAVITWSSSAAATATVSGSGLVTAVASGTARISATAEGQTGSVEVTVSVTELCECTRVIDSTAVKLVQRNDSTGVYVLRVVRGQPPALDSGSIIVGAENGGYLRRVTRTARAGDVITLETETAYLEEVVGEGAFAGTSPIGDASSAEGADAVRWGPWTTTYVAPGLETAASGGCCTVPLDGIVFAVKGVGKRQADSTRKGPDGNPDEGGKESASLSAEVTIKDGEFVFAPPFDIQASFSRFQLQRFKVATQSGLSLNVDAYDLKATASATSERFTWEPQIKKLLVKNKPFSFFIGTVPVVGTITTTIKVAVTPTVSASAVFGGKFRTGYHVSAGVEWVRGSGWKPVSGATAHVEIPAPAFQGVEGTASVKISVVPEVAILLYGVVGPFLNVEPYIEGAATAGLSFAQGAATGLDWETKASWGINLNLGAKVSVLGYKDIAEAGFAIPIIKPRKIARLFSDGPLAVHTSVTGEDQPDSLDIRLREAFVDTLPPFGRDLSTSRRDTSVTPNDSVRFEDVRSGTSYPHVVSLEDLAGNCAPTDTLKDGSPDRSALRVQVAVRSPSFMKLFSKPPAGATFSIQCIPLGALLTGVHTTGPDVPSTHTLTLVRLDTIGSGKGDPPLDLVIGAGPGVRDTLVGGLVPESDVTGASGLHSVTLTPGRKNCAVARPYTNRVTIYSGDTTSTRFRVTCVPLGYVRVKTVTADPDPASSDPVTYASVVTPLEASAGSGVASDATPGTAAGTVAATGSLVVNDLVPLYNASGATGRHNVKLSGVPNRCTLAGQSSQNVTVFPADTAITDFALRCVERLHVSTRSTGPGTDRDGYVVVVEHPGGTADSVPVGIADTVAIAGVEPGTHTIRLSDVDANCTAPPSVVRNINGRDSTLVPFVVDCPGPAAPNGLRATLVQATRIDVAWDPAPAGKPVAYYRLHRTRVTPPVSTRMADSITLVAHSDTGLMPFTQYAYQVEAVDASGAVGPRSSRLVVRTRDGTPPSPATGLSARAVNGSSIDLAWGAAIDPETGIRLYRIYRDGALVDSTAATTWPDRGLTPMTTYSHHVIAVNGEGLVGPASNTATATTPDGTPPTTPTGLTATATGPTSIDLTWSPASDPETGVAFYRVYRGGALVGMATTTAFADTGLKPATTYTYQVSAVNTDSLEGARSTPASATTNPPPVTTGDISVTVSSLGNGVPQAGYQVQVSGNGVQLNKAIGPNATVAFTGLLPQTYAVLLHGLPSNCAATDYPNPASVVVSAGGVAAVSFLVSCR